MILILKKKRVCACFKTNKKILKKRKEYIYTIGGETNKKKKAILQKCVCVCVCVCVQLRLEL